MAEVYSIGAAALAAGKELGATIESAAEKRDKAFQDFDVKYNLTSTMEETVSDTLQPVYRQAAQAALNEAQEAATALEADPNNADLRARVRSAQRQYDEIKNIGVARTAQDNKTRQMIRNGEIEDMAGSIEENLAKMDEMSNMNGKTITMEGGTVMITNPDGSKTPVLSSAYGDVQGVYTPPVTAPASKYNPSLVGTNMNYEKYKLTDGDGTIGLDDKALREGFASDLDVVRRANPDAHQQAMAQNYLVRTLGKTDISKQELDAEAARLQPMIEDTTFMVGGEQVAATTYSIDENGKAVYDLSQNDIIELYKKGEISKAEKESLEHYREVNAMYVEDVYAAEINNVDLTDEIQQRERNITTRSRALSDTERAYQRSLEQAEAAQVRNAFQFNWSQMDDGSVYASAGTSANLVASQELISAVPEIGGILGVADGGKVRVLGYRSTNNQDVTHVEIADPDNLDEPVMVDLAVLGDKKDLLLNAITAVTGTGAKGASPERASVSLGNPPSPSGPDGAGVVDNMEDLAKKQ